MTSYARAFAATGLLALLGAAILHVFVTAQMTRFWSPMVHLMLFGWITALIVAVNYHTLPVFSGRDFPSTGSIWANWAALTFGIMLTTVGMIIHIPLVEVSGFVLELVGALLFVVATMLLFLRGSRHTRRPPQPPIRDQAQVDAVGTCATKAAGLALPTALVLLILVQTGVIGTSWVLAAEHLMALGWVMLMIVGVGYHVLPRFSGQATRGAHWAQCQLWCHLSAVVLIVLALGCGLPKLFATAGLVMAGAIALFAWTIWPTLRALPTRQTTPIQMMQKKQTP